MSIYLTDEIEVKTKKGKMGGAKQIFLEGDTQTVEKEIKDINSRHDTLNTKHESLSKTVQGISATGKANTATEVTYNNTNSGIVAENIQDAVDKLAAKDATKAEKADVQSSVSELKAKDTAQDTEIAKKFNKENIAQELGESKDKVVSQFALPFREIESPEFIKAIVDAENHFLLGIQLDGSIEWGKGIPAPIRAKLQEIINQCQQDKTDIIEAFNSANTKLNNELSDARKYLNVNLYGKKISFLGDSLSTFKDNIPFGNATYYPNDNNDVTLVEQTWWMNLVNNSNAQLEINNSFSGSKVSGSKESSYTKRVENLGNPDYIIIHGGTNDIWQNVPVGTLHFDLSKDNLNKNEFADSYDLMIRKCRDLYPHANIILVIPHNVSVEYTSIIEEISVHYNLFGLVDLHESSFVLVNGHYQIVDMQTVTSAVSKVLYNNKNVLREEGKSLIEDEVKECFRVIENEEFLKAIVDTEDRVLFGIYRESGKPYFPLNEMYHVEQNEEFFAVWLDADDKVLFGIRRDGEIIGEIHAVNALKQVIFQLQSDLASLQEKVGTIDNNLKELLDVFSLEDNPEYLAVEKDAEGKVLSSTNADGSHYSHNLKSETIDAKVDKEEGKSLIDADVSDAHRTLEDLEGRTEITVDTEEKVISYRDSEGKKHELDMEVVNLDVSNINLKGNSVNNIQDALKANGFDVKTPIDWSECSFIQIPEPRFAIINVTNIDSMPTTKTQNKKAFLEFWDMHGNYFKKHAVLNAQGNSSLHFVKKNIAIDLCDDEWIGDDTPKIRIGEWIPQDSFHMKAYYTDFFRGVGAATYKLYDQIVCTRGNRYDRPWKKALLDISKIEAVKSFGNPYVGDYTLLTDTGARCFPDGFPVVVYLNNEFYGIFSFQLKKHRDNYHLDKSKAENIHLDGTINYNILWNGTIVWGTGDNGFEVRNPKNLYAIGGNKYDADIKQEEIAGEEEVNTWIAAGQLPDGTSISSKIKKNLQMTAKVKKYIQDFANTFNAIQLAASTYEASSKSEEDLNMFKQVFEKYYDVENLIDYVITSDITKNVDGFAKNWQWFTYNGVKWFVGMYDCDICYGASWDGSKLTRPLSKHLESSLNLPTGYIIKYYESELNSRYKYLADKGIISSDNIFSFIKDWTVRIGTSFYEEEYKKWKDSPCIENSVIRSTYWELVTDKDGNPQTTTSETFDATKAYNFGDEVSFGLDTYNGYYRFKCISNTIAQETYVPHSVSTPYSPIKEYKHCDSIYRIQKWIEENVNNLDKVYSYSRN